MDEATARNFVAFHECPNIPSYALWSDDDILRETCSERLKWWKSARAELLHSEEIQTIAQVYISVLEYELFHSSEATSTTYEYDYQHHMTGVTSSG